MIAHHARAGLQDILGPLFDLMESAFAAALVRCIPNTFGALLIHNVYFFKVETLLYGVRFCAYVSSDVPLTHGLDLHRIALHLTLSLRFLSRSEKKSRRNNYSAVLGHHVLTGNGGCCIDFWHGSSRHPGIV